MNSTIKYKRASVFGDALTPAFPMCGVFSPTGAQTVFRGCTRLNYIILYIV